MNQIIPFPTASAERPAGQSPSAPSPSAQSPGAQGAGAQGAGAQSPWAELAALARHPVQAIKRGRSVAPGPDDDDLPPPRPGGKAMRAVRWPGWLNAAGPGRDDPGLVPLASAEPRRHAVQAIDDAPADPRGFAIRSQQKVIAHYRRLLAVHKIVDLERQSIESRLAKAEAELAELCA
jgi:hypothetical protein